MKDKWLEDLIKITEIRISLYKQHASKEDYRFKQLAEIEQHILYELNKLKGTEN